MGAIIRFFIASPVAANLLMIAIIGAGLFAASNITVRTFPEIATSTVTVEVAYPGATPSEVADAILTPIEEQLQGLEGVRELSSTAQRSLGVVSAELTRGADLRAVKDDIETEVARITTFPDAAETPRISEVEPDELAIQLAVVGDRPLAVLKGLAEEIRGEITDLASVSRAELQGLPVDQIDIEVTREMLEAYGIGLTGLAQLIDAQDIDLSGGTIDTGASEVQLRTVEDAETALGLRDVLLFRSGTGATVRLEDIAVIEDTFEESAIAADVSGRPAVFISVYRSGTEQVLGIVDEVQRYLGEELAQRLPDSIEVIVWRNEGEQLQNRIDLLAKNGAIGVCLILFVLMLFLDLRIAAWVAVGVVVAFVGAFIPMLLFGVTINQLSLFGFILALGIVVDDAIVVGENVFTELEETDDAKAAASAGATRVWQPILSSVTTTILAFTPLLFLPGSSGSFIAPIASVVIFVLIMSVIESFFVLPKHLSHLSIREPRRFSPRRLTEPLRRAVDRVFRKVTDGPLSRLVNGAIAHPIFAIAVCIAILVGSAGLVAGGVVKFVFFPNIEGNFVVAELELPEGTSDQETRERAAILVEAAARAAEEVSGPDLLVGTAVTLGFASGGGSGGGAGPLVGNLATVEAKLQDANQREVGAQAFLNAWRKAAGEVAGAKRLSFSASVVGIGDPIVLEVSADDETTRDAAIERLREALSARSGVFDIRDDRFSSAQEIALTLTPAAQAYGVDATSLANEVRGAFFGITINQFARDREEVDVRLRLAEGQRDSIADLLRLRIPSDEGLIPIGTVAELSFQPAATVITRVDGRTIATLTADVDNTVTTGGAETSYVTSEIVPELAQDYPSVVVSAGGEQEESQRFAAALQSNFAIAVFAIFVVISLAFGSYLRPIIVLLVIPFGIVGALLGHALLGLNLTLLSLFGIIGLSGVIVNGALLIVDFIGENQANGMAPREAIRAAALSRFRPIVLTTLTTFFGVTPLILEQSVQAKFLIPTAVALGFGILFASILQMALVPALASLTLRARRKTRPVRDGAR
ncbi:efflux RND transporter permease subunit [Acuticoccus sp. MNP-M23]|uniref:efflux RND transporter permease subunit n=1 Tax=Acuticoccus sp. MNP-M23 TaxID=3072793 RepID=UPI002814BBC6|nr:efflux RND transporter permease subunit [Acuticoccus sp. MNP-M23]WMS41894.1 efflux RND transporter permease subunit [Acuticoccus sp. MNP-M23]